VAPHLLLIGGSFDVESIDPSPRKARLVAALTDVTVSPNGRWIAGSGPGDPMHDVEANTTYVVSLQGRPHCLAVPGLSHIVGFTRDGKEVRVTSESGADFKPGQVKQYAISSLRASCPTGFNGILDRGSQWFVDVNSPGWG